MISKDFLVKNIRTLFYIFALLIAVSTLVLFSQPANALVLTNAFGYLSFSFLSLSLLVTPVRTVFPTFNLNPVFYMGRRALGVCAFVFAVAHYAIQLSLNFAGDPGQVVFFAFSPNGSGLLAGIISLLFLFLLFITSTDFAARKLGKHWFRLHQLSYLCYPLIIFHVVSIGIDFKDINFYSGSFACIAMITIVFELIRFYFILKKKK